MQEQVVLLAAVSLLGVLEQAYFSLQVIYARRKYSVPPPATSGHPDFERVYRAQVNSSEYFPIFLTVLWVSGVFFSQGYAKSAQGRLAPLYFSAKILWVLIVFSSLGVLCSLFRFHLDMDLPQLVLRGLVE